MNKILFFNVLFTNIFFSNLAIILILILILKKNQTLLIQIIGLQSTNQRQDEKAGFFSRLLFPFFFILFP